MHQGVFEENFGLGYPYKKGHYVTDDGKPTKNMNEACLYNKEMGADFIDYPNFSNFFEKVYLDFRYEIKPKGTYTVYLRFESCFDVEAVSSEEAINIADTILDTLDAHSAQSKALLENITGAEIADVELYGY